jgi:hypothetical protein
MQLGLGNINPKIYQMAAAVPSAFHDVTSGNNIVPCYEGPDCTTGSFGYTAGPGYDLTTGWGSLDVNTFFQNWEVLASTCNYALNLSGSVGQVFPAQGGTGTVAITTGSNCPWTVNTIPAGITLTSPASGTGSGTVTFLVSPNNGGDLSGSLTIAGQSFTIGQEAASIPGLSFIGSMPHIAAEENWWMEFTLVNKRR